MRIRIVILVLVLVAACPPVSHGFGVLRWACDAISNTLGFDRGPVPKVVALTPCQPAGPAPNHSRNLHPDMQRIYLQASGW
jgi:hypothetical protein